MAAPQRSGPSTCIVSPKVYDPPDRIKMVERSRLREASNGGGATSSPPCLASPRGSAYYWRRCNGENDYCNNSFI